MNEGVDIQSHSNTIRPFRSEMMGSLKNKRAQAVRVCENRILVAWASSPCTNPEGRKLAPTKLTNLPYIQADKEKRARNLTYAKAMSAGGENLL